MLTYASPLLTISQKICNDILKPTKHIYKHANNLPSSMSDEIFHAPFSLGGLNAFDLHIYTFSIRVKWLACL